MYHRLTNLLYDNRDTEKAAKMTVYMKDNFPFLGIQKTTRAQLQKDLIKLAKKRGHIGCNFVSTQIQRCY